MENEQFKTNPYRSISLKKAEVVEYDQEHYQHGLFFPITSGCDLRAIGSDALLGNLFINVTAQQLRDLRDTLNNMEI